MRALIVVFFFVGLGLFMIAIPSSRLVQPVAPQVAGPTSVTASTPSDLPQPWPPVVGQAYPNLVLKNAQGEEVRLSDFKGKVLIVKPIGLSCPACNAFEGAATQGGFQGVVHQKGLPSSEELFLKYGGVDLADEGIVVVHLLLFDPTTKNAPTPEEAQAWSKHFGLDQRPNSVVLLGEPGFVKVSYDLIPGFQLVDKQFVLRADSTGHKPKDDLYRKLAPMVKELLAE